MEICIVNMVLFIPNGGSLSVCPLTHLTSSGKQPLNRNSTHTDQYQVRGVEGQQREPAVSSA